MEDYKLRDLRVSHTGLVVELEHLKIETRLIDEKFANAMCECKSLPPLFSKSLFPPLKRWFVVLLSRGPMEDFYEQQIKRELKGIHTCGCRCNERLKDKT